MNAYNYGFEFNDIQIDKNVLIKKYKNQLGKIKINNEINFYLYIIKNNVNFPMPKLINCEDGHLSLNYIFNSTTLTEKINSTNIYECVEKIKKHLNSIHKIECQVPYNIIQNDTIIETKKKVINRYNEYDWDNDLLYNSIKSDNNVNIKNIYYYCEIIETKIISYIKNRNFYNLIHGDVHLGNILIEDNKELYFIDPRGYFGETQLFGLYEYDYAKLMFGLSGYSVFDNMVIDELNIVNGNITIDFIKKYEFIFQNKDIEFDKVTTLLCLSIWLANNSCFLNINKKITSLMIAYYYCEKYMYNC